MRSRHAAVAAAPPTNCHQRRTVTLPLPLPPRRRSLVGCCIVVHRPISASHAVMQQSTLSLPSSTTSYSLKNTHNPLPLLLHHLRHCSRCRRHAVHRHRAFHGCCRPSLPLPLLSPSRRPSPSCLPLLSPLLPSRCHRTFCRRCVAIAPSIAVNAIHCRHRHSVHRCRRRRIAVALLSLPSSLLPSSLVRRLVVAPMPPPLVISRLLSAVVLLAATSLPSFLFAGWLSRQRLRLLSSLPSCPLPFSLPPPPPPLSWRRPPSSSLLTTTKRKKMMVVSSSASAPLSALSLSSALSTMTSTTKTTASSS